MSESSVQRGVWMLEVQISDVDSLLRFWEVFGPWNTQPERERL